MTESILKCLVCGYDLDCDFVSDPHEVITCSKCNTEYSVDFKNGEPSLKPRRWIPRIFGKLKSWFSHKK